MRMANSPAMSNFRCDRDAVKPLFHLGFPSMSFRQFRPMLCPGKPSPLLTRPLTIVAPAKAGAQRVHWIRWAV